MSPRAEPIGLVEGAGRFVVEFPRRAPITTPAVYRGKVFVSGGFHGKEFYAVEAKTGRTVWARNLDDDGPSAPACAEGICVFNTESCTIFALDEATGGHIWSWWMGDPMMSAPAISGDLVYTSWPSPSRVHRDASHVLAALELRTGRLRWQRRIDGDVVSSPVVAGGRVLLSTFSGTVMTLDAATGEILTARRGRATSAPTYRDARLYYAMREDMDGDPATEAVAAAEVTSSQVEYTSSSRHAAYLDRDVQSGTRYFQDAATLDAMNGFVGGAPSTAKSDVAYAHFGQTSVSSLQRFQGSRVASDGTRNYTSMGDEVVATDPGTGERRWAHNVAGDLRAAGGAIVAAPALAGGRVVVGTLSGLVLVLDAESGAVRRTFDAGAPIRAQVVVEDGWIYAASEDGRLVGLDTGDPTLTGWPMWGGDAARTAVRY